MHIGKFAVCVLLALMAFCLIKEPGAGAQAAVSKESAIQSSQARLKDALEARVKTEWEAIKARDKKAYASLLADDYVAVEVDGKGTRDKLHALSELEISNVRNYTLFGFSVIPLGTNAAFTTYESTMEFFPKAQVRFLRIYVGELWVNDGGQWKARHYQETSVR
jgi:Domain of unknown function (DUF4440)